MRRKRLGSAGPEITRIGIGTWAHGGGGWKYAWGPQDDRESIAAIHRGLDLGVNWIDTAAVYGLGHAEEVVGRALKGRRDRVILATKCGRVWTPANPVPGHDLSAASIRAELEASLRRLATDVIDLYQIHWPVPDEAIEEAWGEIARAIGAGKVRWAGVSNFSVEQLRRVQAIHPVTSLQPPYSMLRREAERDLLPYCAANGIGVVCYSPMQAGLLTGTFSRERAARLPADDWRRANPLFQEPALGKALDLVDHLRPIAARNHRSLGELAVAWVLRRPEVTAAIVGARRPAQIEETAPAADWDLPEADAAEIEGLLG